MLAAAHWQQGLAWYPGLEEHAGASCGATSTPDRLGHPMLMPTGQTAQNQCSHCCYVAAASWDWHLPEQKQWHEQYWQNKGMCTAPSL